MAATMDFPLALSVNGPHSHHPQRYHALSAFVDDVAMVLLVVCNQVVYKISRSFNERRFLYPKSKDHTLANVVVVAN